MTEGGMNEWGRRRDQVASNSDANHKVPYASNQDFEKFRPEITELYLTQNKTLGEVMLLMAERHSLRGT
jgi:hypothetical protein